MGGHTTDSWRIFANVVCWWSAAVAITFIIKSTVSDDDAIFPYSFALTGMTNMFCTPLAFLLSRMVDREGDWLPNIGRSDLLRVGLVGVIQGIELACNNKSLEFLSVSERTILNSSSVLFMMVTSSIWGLERMGLTKAVAAALITIGGLSQGMSDNAHSSFRIQGVLLQITSLVLSAQRWALLQLLMQRSKTGAFATMSKLQLTALIMPTTGVVCFAFALVFEPQAFSFAKMLNEVLLRSVLGICACIVFITVSELNIVQLTSAVAMQVFGTVHQIPLVLSGIFIFGDRVSVCNASGFALSIIGTLVYFVGRRIESKRQSDGALVGPTELSLVTTSPIYEVDSATLLAPGPYDCEEATAEKDA